jgi:CRP-like cAMP-binding protein
MALSLVDHSYYTSPFSLTLDTKKINLSKSESLPVAHIFAETNGYHMEKFAEKYQNHPLFENLSFEEFQSVISCSEVVVFSKNDFIAKENTYDDFLHIILDGKVKITKKRHGQEFLICYLDPQALIGEISILDEIPKTANAIADAPTTTLMINFKKLKKIPGDLTLYQKLMLELGKITSRKLIISNEKTIALIEERTILAQFALTVLSITIVCSAFILLGRNILKDLPLSTFFSFFIVISVFFLVLRMIKKTGKSLSYFGITLQNWKEECYIGLIYSLPLCVIAIIFKFIFLYFIQEKKDIPLFDIHSTFYHPSHFSFVVYFLAILLYIIIAPFQNIGVQSGVQIALEKLLSSQEYNKSPWIAFCLTSFLFAGSHLYLGYFFSVLVFFPTLLWCWMFHKRRSIVGPSISHILIGVFVIFILGIDSLY